VTLQRAAVVVNPTKFTDTAEVRRTVTRVCAEHGWGEPLWLETTAEDPGAGQARQALDEGVDLVCALGGDGTVRTVAEVVTGSGTSLGLLPAGTGNLLARNLGLPLDSVRGALTVALTGHDVAIDSCLLEIVRPTTAQLVQRLEDEHDPARSVDLNDAVDDRDAPEVRSEHRFLVMAGVGFDAEVMAAAPERLKARVGWLAHLVTGLQHLKGPQFTVAIRYDDAAPVRRRARSLVVGNVGKLQGGFELLPDAVADDGHLDTVLLSPDGIVGWAATLAQLVTRAMIGHPRVEHVRCRDVKVVSDKPIEVEVDGDILGQAMALWVRVDPGSLLVRLPAGAGRLDALGGQHD
jgi:diacylglycerol kinase (ATP)